MHRFLLFVAIGSSLIICLLAQKKCKHFRDTASLNSSRNCLDASLQKLLASDKAMPYVFEKLVHCKPEKSLNDLICNQVWHEPSKRFIWSLKDHYSELQKQKNHSLNRVDRSVPKVAHMSKLLKLDIVIDARCHHSWPYNPYHRYAECLIFILPALNNYLIRMHAERKDKLGGASVKIALIVDESTEMLCETFDKKTDFEGNLANVSSDDVCLMNDFHWLLRTKYYYQCIKISIFKKSIYWHKLQRYVSVGAKELIWLEEQSNPYTYGSGFMNVKAPNYEEFVKQYRDIMFRAYCRQCRVPKQSIFFPLTESSRKTFGFALPQKFIVLIRRKAKTGRDFIQHESLRSELLSLVNSRPEWASQYSVVEYDGSESLCVTIAMFWSAKVIIAAHGAGMVNAIFSRPETLMIEITPDKLLPEQRGEAWRSNSPFVQSVGLSTHIIVVPHNTSAKSDSDIQKVCSLSLRPDHIAKVIDLTRAALSDGIGAGANDTRLRTRGHHPNSVDKTYSRTSDITAML